MSFTGNGELVPVGGGDPIPLIRPQLTIGRRESCDICMRLANVSGRHAELSFSDGHWYITDLGSTNGLKVNGVRIPPLAKKILHPQDVITLAKRQFTIHYTPIAAQRLEKIVEDMEEEDILSQPLLERAGLVKKRADRKGKEQSVDFGLDEDEE